MYIPHLHETQVDAVVAATIAVTYDTLLHNASEPSATSWSSLIGIITAIIGNILISFALNIQRYAHLRLERDSYGGSRDESHETDGRAHSTNDQNGIGMKQSGREMRPPNVEQQEHNESTPLLSAGTDQISEASQERRSFDSGSSEGSGKKKNYLKSPLWWAGISLMIIGEAGNFLAYGFAPASIVSPLGVVALISNCLIAPIFLHEKFRKRDPLGVLIAVGGAVTVVLSGQGSNPRLGPEEILDLVKRWEFLTYLGICIALIAILMVASNRFGERTIAIDMGLVGLLGGFTALSTKGIASLLSNKIWRMLTYPISYVLVLVLIITAVGQIKYVNRALARFDSTRVIPAQFVAFTIGVIVGSTILYRDFEKATTADIIQFVGGCVLTFLGVWIITSGRGSDEIDDEAHDCNHESNLVAPEIKTNPETNPNAIIMVDNDPPTQAVSAKDLPPASAASSPSTPKARARLTSISDDMDSPSSFTTARSNAATPAKPRLPPHAISDPALPPPALSSRTALSSSDSSHPVHAATSLPSATLQLPSTTDSPITHDAVVLPPSTIHPTQNQPPSTPPNAMNPQILLTPHPRSSTVSRRSFLLSRETFSELIPKPLTSPLSSGLSAVVADAARRADLRRENSLKRGGSYRRPSDGRDTIQGDLRRTTTRTETGEGNSRTP